MEHSEGPWEVGKMSPVSKGKPQMIVVRAVNSPMNSHIVPVGPDDNPENEANAALIAASPMLLEAVERFLESSACTNDCEPDDMTCDTNFARAAIASAKGN